VGLAVVLIAGVVGFLVTLTFTVIDNGDTLDRLERVEAEVSERQLLRRMERALVLCSRSPRCRRHLRVARRHAIRGSRATVAPARRSSEQLSPVDDSAARAPQRKVAKRPDRDTRPPATINPPDTTPDRFPPPARIPEPQGPGGPRPGEAPPPQRPERPTIIERVCDRIALVPERVC
jgi:hypothetical protein